MLSAVLLMLGVAPARAQDAAGASAAGTANAAATVPSKADVPPKLPKGWLQDLINAVVPQQPAPTVFEPAPPSAATPTGTPSAPEIDPKPVPPTLPPSAAITPGGSTPPPHPAAIVPKLPHQPEPASPRAPETATTERAAATPLPAAIEPPPSVAPPAAIAPPFPIAEPAEPTRMPVRAYLLTLLIAAAAAAALLQFRRLRRIAYTRAALALVPRIDPAAGAGSTAGLALVGPALAIRARLGIAEPVDG